MKFVGKVSTNLRGLSPRIPAALLIESETKSCE